MYEKISIDSNHDIHGWIWNKFRWMHKESKKCNKIQFCFFKIIKNIWNVNIFVWKQQQQINNTKQIISTNFYSYCQQNEIKQN